MNAAEDLVDSISVLLRVFTMSERRFPAAEGRMRYSGLDFETLEFLEKHPGSRASDLAGHLGVSATTVQSIVDRLSKRDLIARDTSGATGRSVPLTLTPEGLQLRAAIHRQNLANCRTMLEALPAEDRHAFISQVRAIARHVAP